MGEHNKKYRWPCSALEEKEMAFLTRWRERTGAPITKLLKQAVQICQQQIEKGGNKHGNKTIKSPQQHGS